MSHSLSVSPNPANFGLIPVLSTASIDIICKEIGPDDGVPIDWDSAITGPNADQFHITDDSGGASSGPGGEGNVTVQFAPTSPGVKTATLTITGNAFGPFINSPVHITLNGNGSAGGFLTITPQTTNDFGNVQDGTPSAPLNVVLQNNSGTDVLVTAIAFNGDFTTDAPLPALPFTLHAGHADPAVVIPVIFTPSVTGFHVTANAVSVTSNATNSPTLQSLQGTGVIITPSYSVPITPQAVLMAFVLGGVVQILRMDTTNLDCEEQGFFRRIYDWGSPLFEKYLGRVIFRYEDEYVAGFGFAVQARIPRAPNAIATNVIGGGLNDGLIHNAFGDLQVTGDLIEIEVNRAGSSGPVSITEIFHEVDKRGEVVEAV